MPLSTLANEDDHNHAKKQSIAAMARSKLRAMLEMLAEGICCSFEACFAGATTRGWRVGLVVK
jgi:hypothetical protein